MSIFRRRKKFVVNEPDPCYNVVYLGNVLTALAKGDGCTDKPLALIWRTYCTRSRPDAHMCLSVTKSGLKVTTKQRGLTEYWAHRITYCVASPDYPKLFCWIYKHEGKKMKPELRCHAVLCKKAEHPPAIALLLHEKITSALMDYKREKLSRQQTRLSGSMLGYPSLPMRKQMLSVGGQNFRPPMSRSKSAPKLHSIDEEEDEEEQQPSSANIDYVETLIEHVEDSANSDDDLTPNAEPSSLFGRALPPFSVDLEIGHDIEQLRLDAGVQRSLRRGSSSTDTEVDSISDESGYHEEKTSLDDEDDDDSIICVYAV